MMTLRAGTIAVSLAFAVLGVFIFFQSATLDERAALFPRVAASLMVAGAIGSVLRTALVPTDTAPAFEGISWLDVCVVAGLFGLSLVLVGVVGFPIAAALFFVKVAVFKDRKGLSLS